MAANLCGASVAACFFRVRGFPNLGFPAGYFFSHLAPKLEFAASYFFLRIGWWFLMQFGGSWKIKVLVENDHKKAVFSTVDFNGRFKGRIHVILRLLIFTCLVLGC